MPRTRTIALIVFLMFAVAFWKTASIPGTASASNEVFTDLTEQAGITWQQFGGESPDRFLIETMGGGVAFFDFDKDGLLDIFLINGGETPHGKSPLPLSNALYRNLGNGKFENVAAKAGLEQLNFYGMGVAAADFDNDGYQDLYTTGYPASALYHNNRDGTFTDVTDKAGVKSAGKWAAGAAWFDYDRDGFPDFVVTNFNDQYHSLFLGSKSLPFSDRTNASHLANLTRSFVGWGAKCFDYDNDGDLDLMLVNGHINQEIDSTRVDVSYREP